MAYDEMTTHVPHVVLIGNATRGPFTLNDSSGNPIRVRTHSHLVVRRYSSVTDETGTALALNTDFTVSNSDVDAVTITLTSAQAVLASTERLVVTRLQSLADVISLSSGGNFSAEALSAAMSVLTEELQEVRRDVDRSIKPSWRNTVTPSLPIAPAATKFLAHTSDDELTHVEITDISPTGVTLGAGWSSALALDSDSVLDNLAGVRFVATYAALTALMAATGLADGAVYATRARATADDGGAGLWRYDAASTATANGGTILAIDGGGAGRFFRLYTGAIQAKWFTPFDNSTDETTTLQAAITAAQYNTLELPGNATAIVTAVTGVSDIIIKGPRSAVIKRKASSSVGTMLDFTNRNNFKLIGFTLDGNKANQTNGGNNLGIYSGCHTYDVDGIRTTGAKASGGYGAGAVILDGGGIAARKASFVQNCLFDLNDTSGLLVDEEWSLTIRGNFALSNTDCGIDVTNTDLPFESQRHNYIRILDNECHLSGNCNIRVYGFVTGAGPVATADYSPTETPPGYGMIVSGNRAVGAIKYGIAASLVYGQITDNFAWRNGDSLSNGGFLANSYNTRISGNVAFDNYGYGMDAGGAYNCTVTDNLFAFNGSTDNAQAVGLNIGGSRDCTVSSNIFTSNGNGSGGYQIVAIGVEGDGGATGYFSWIGTALGMYNNRFVAANSNQIGVYVAQGFEAVTMSGNTARGFGTDKAWQIETNQLCDAGGNIDQSAGIVPTIASATTTVIPDLGENIYVSGTTNITTVRTRSQNAWHEKVRAVSMAAYGGTTKVYSVAPTVTFTGGGGASAAGTARLNNDGYVVAIEITNAGSGYTSAPTVGFTGGTVTSGSVDPAGTALINCHNQEGRKVNVLFQAILTVTDGSNLNLVGNLVTTGSTSLQLRGAYGSWYEQFRAAT